MILIEYVFYFKGSLMKHKLVCYNTSDIYNGNVYNCSIEERVNVSITQFFNNTFLNPLNPNLTIKSIMHCNLKGENENDNYFYRGLIIHMKNNDEQILFIDRFKDNQVTSEISVTILNASNFVKWQLFKKIKNINKSILKKTFFAFFYKEIDEIRKDQKIDFTLNSDFKYRINLKENNHNNQGFIKREKNNDQFDILYSQKISCFKYQSIGQLTTALTLQYSLFKRGIDYSLDTSFKLSMFFFEATKKTYFYDHEIHKYADFVSNHYNNNDKEFFDLIELNYSY